MSEIFFISDTHFGHSNILTFKDFHEQPLREFSSVEEMDELMVERWNRTVRPSDHIYHLGDVAMKRPDLAIVKRLNGHKRLLFGNHDIYDVRSYTEVGFEKFFGTRRLDDIIFSHFPIHPDSIGKAVLNAHGHTHSNWSPIGRYANLSVEMINYTPVPLHAIRGLMQAQQEALQDELDNSPCAC